jgi:HNH endonuclease
MCPYCQGNLSNSDDHIFPQFLGGRATVKACLLCNNHIVLPIVRAETWPVVDDPDSLERSTDTLLVVEKW